MVKLPVTEKPEWLIQLEKNLEAKYGTLTTLQQVVSNVAFANPSDDAGVVALLIPEDLAIIEPYIERLNM